VIPADSIDWITHAPPSQRAAYCMAWASDRALWLKPFKPGERAHVRLVMRRVCRG
jgi:hypothetical protein